MKNKFYILIFACLTLGFYACSEDKISASDEERNREYMAMFRWNENGIPNDDERACRVVNTNDIYLAWYGIEGCAGYRIKMKLYGGDWEDPLDMLLDTIVAPDVLSLLVEDLQYDTRHCFAIQTLSAKGEQYNSLWYGHGDSGHNSDRAEWITGSRVAVPDVIQVTDITETSMRVVFDLTFQDGFGEEFQHENGKFLMDQLTVVPSRINRELPSFSHTLTAADLERGYVDFDGLSANAVYVVNGLNNKIVRYWDRLYNTTMVRMQGQIGEPILLEHIVDTLPAAITHQASRIDTILHHYMSDNSLAEGTIFLLEPGKNYYFHTTLEVSKGFILRCEDPNNRPNVFFGLGQNEDGTPASTPNLSLGRRPESGEMGGVSISVIEMENIKFDSPYALNFGTGKVSANYFINQYSNSMAFSCNSFILRNCDFQRFIRGWVRFQGTTRKTIDHWIVEDCLFHNMGYYANDGRGYGYIQGDGVANSNIFRDMQFRRNTFVDSPLTALFIEGANVAWAESWNILLDNNTFVNWNTRSTGRNLFEMRNNPSNSTFTCRNNLFIQTKADDDDRTMHMSGIDVRNFVGVQFDFSNNYSTNTYLTNGSIFSANAFSASRGPGYLNGALNKEGMEETQVKLGETGISPLELMVDPNPIAKNGEVNMHVHNLDGLYYRNTPAVRNHEIYRLGIGDPRWAVTVTP